MKIRFRDVSSGIVEARAVLEIKEGILLNEITILSRNGQIEVELPQKSFKGKDGKMHLYPIAMPKEKTEKKVEVKTEKEVEPRTKPKPIRLHK